MSEYTPQDQADFRKARARSFLRSAWSLISGKNTKLLAWDEVRESLGLRGLVHRGMQTVPLDKIIGSVGRYRDFDNEFLPTTDSSSGRWRKINRAFYDDINLPPIHLYKVGEVYFVLDGNHRVSVAREHGASYIDAEVQEALVRVPLTIDDLRDVDADSLEMLGEYQSFLERTRLDVLRPGQVIRFSIGGGYGRLIEHISVHRYFMGLDLKRDISEDEAVEDWYDNVYMPIIQAVRTDGILADFPNRTESDLYLWVIDHQHYLREQCDDCDIDAEDAALSYAEHYGEKHQNPLKKVVDAVGDLIVSITEPARGNND